jgi:DNA repair exonuclease SbcCD nuclease subunit
MSHAPSSSRAPAHGADGEAFRFVHCADVHLDGPFRCASDDVRARLQDAGRAAFRRVADLCLAERVHALLIAGDLFDDERLSFGTEDFLVEQLARLTGAGIHVVAVAGNHDHGGAESRGARIAWPEARFTLLSGHEPEEVAITAPDGRTLARIIGCGHAHAQDAENLAALCASLAPPLTAASTGARVPGAPPVIGLLHARVAEASGAERHPPLAPCSLGELTAAGVRYWALGHVHRRQALSTTPAVHYPGTLIGHDDRETGAHGALLVTVPASGDVRVEFRPLAGVRWETLALPQLAELRDLAAIRVAVTEEFLRLRSASAVELAAAGCPDSDAHELRWMLRLPLAGACPAAPELQRDELVEELSEQLTAELSEYGVLAVDIVEEGLHRPVELSPHRGQPHVLGLSLELVDELFAEPELLARLQPAVLAGCEGADETVKRDYLRSLLTRMDCAAGEALLKETLA